MFLAATTVFAVFTVFYGFFAAAILYHLKQYTLPGHPLPRIISGIFLFLSILFWLFALTFLFKIR